MIIHPQITSTATCRWNRDVDRSLYGSRKYASKNPSLSPITESLYLRSQATAALALPTSSAAFTGRTCTQQLMCVCLVILSIMDNYGILFF